MEINILSAVARGIAALRGPAHSPDARERPRDVAAELNATLPPKPRQPLLRPQRGPSADTEAEPALAWLGAEYAREYPQAPPSVAFGR